MEKQPNVLAIIPARGGSKGVKRKNVRPLCNKPLIYYSITEAKSTKRVSRVVVSTEDEEIAQVSRSCGAEVIPRPAELASDTAGMIPVLEHAVKYLQKKEGYKTDVIVLLPPTTPLRVAADIDGALQLFQSAQCDSVLGVYPAEHPPYWSLKIDKGYVKSVFPRNQYYARKQDLPQAYLDGPVYVMEPKKLFKNKGFLTKKTKVFVMPRQNGLDIDTEFDFELCEFFMRKRAGQL